MTDTDLTAAAQDVPVTKPAPDRFQIRIQRDGDTWHVYGAALDGASLLFASPLMSESDFDAAIDRAKEILEQLRGTWKDGA